MKRRDLLVTVGVLAVINVIVLAVVFNNQQPTTELDRLATSAINAHRSGDLDQALALYAQALAIEESALLYYNRGAAQYQRGDTEAAMSDLQASIALQSDYAPPYQLLGQIADESGSAQQALTYYRQYVTLAGSGGRDVNTIEARIAQLEAATNQGD